MFAMKPQAMQRSIVALAKYRYCTSRQSANARAALLCSSRELLVVVLQIQVSVLKRLLQLFPKKPLLLAVPSTFPCDRKPVCYYVRRDSRVRFLLCAEALSHLTLSALFDWSAPSLMPELADDIPCQLSALTSKAAD